MTTELHTPHLMLVPLSYYQLECFLSHRSALADELGLRIDDSVIDENVVRAIGIKLAKMSALPLEKHPWQTYWLIVVSEPKKVGAGLIGFKGYLNPEGETEIGYGISPQYQGKGYMTEAVRALCAWAFANGCRAVTATTVVNPASNRVLEKVGAVVIERGAKSLNWKIYPPGT